VDKLTNKLTSPLFYRGNKEILKRAKVAAALSEKTLGKYIDEALEEKIKKETK